MSGHKDIDCDKARELLDSFHDNELSGEERELIQSHLGECSGCSTALAEISSVSSLLKSIPRQELRKDFADDLAAVVFEPSKNSVEESKIVSINKAPRKNFTFAYVAAAAACLVALAVSLPHLLGGNDSNSVLVTKETKNPANSEISRSADKPGDNIDERVAELSEPGESVVQDKEIVAEKESGKQEANKDSGINSDMNSKMAKATPSVVASSDSQTPAPVVAVDKKRPVETAVQTKPESTNMVANIPQSASTAVSGSYAKNQISQDELHSNEAVVAYEGDEPDGLFSQMGIGTDEDGLYAIKL